MLANATFLDIRRCSTTTHAPAARSPAPPLDALHMRCVITDTAPRATRQVKSHSVTSCCVVLRHTRASLLCLDKGVRSTIGFITYTTVMMRCLRNGPHFLFLRTSESINGLRSRSLRFLLQGGARWCIYR